MPGLVLRSAPLKRIDFLINTKLYVSIDMQLIRWFGKKLTYDRNDRNLKSKGKYFKRRAYHHMLLVRHLMHFRKHALYPRAAVLSLNPNTLRCVFHRRHSLN